jgi:hypothetical protein
VINGNLNIYGGADNPEAILPWKIINQFQGKVFYLMCDPELPLKQIWGAIDPVKRPTWTSNYKEEDYVITREDIICVSQAPNLDVVMEEVLKKPGIKMGKVVQFSFEKFPCRRPNQPPFNSQPTYALSYGGTMRNGRREKKMVKYYFGYPDNVKIEMFGKIKLEDFKPKLVDGLRPPEFYGYAKYDEMLTRLNGSVAHVVIGDPLYERPELIARYLKAFSRPGALVWEPFAGGGTIPAVCKMHHRNYIAFEIDPATAVAARERVANTQPMHPAFVADQSEMFESEAA